MELPKPMQEFINNFSYCFLAFNLTSVQLESKKHTLIVKMQAFYSKNRIINIKEFAFSSEHSFSEISKEYSYFMQMLEYWYEEDERIIRWKNDTDYFLGKHIYILADKFDLHRFITASPSGKYLMNRSLNDNFPYLNLRIHGNRDQEVSINSEYFSYLLNSESSETSELFRQLLKEFISDSYDKKINVLKQQINEFENARKNLLDSFSKEDQLLLEV